MNEHDLMLFYSVFFLLLFLFILIVIWWLSQPEPEFPHRKEWKRNV